MFAEVRLSIYHPPCCLHRAREPQFGRIIILVSINLRTRQFISVPRYRTRFGQSDPMSAMCRTFINNFDLFDFNIPQNVFRDRLRTQLT